MSYHTEIEYISRKVFEYEKREILEMHNIFIIIFMDMQYFNFYGN